MLVNSPCTLRGFYSDFLAAHNDVYLFECHGFTFLAKVPIQQFKFSFLNTAFIMISIGSLGMHTFTGTVS